MFQVTIRHPETAPASNPSPTPRRSSARATNAACACRAGRSGANTPASTAARPGSTSRIWASSSAPRSMAHASTTTARSQPPTRSRWGHSPSSSRIESRPRLRAPPHKPAQPPPARPRLSRQGPHCSPHRPHRSHTPPTPLTPRTPHTPITRLFRLTPHVRPPRPRQSSSGASTSTRPCSTPSTCAGATWCA